MTVQELIDLLSERNATDLVVVAADAEGNSFSPMEGAFSEGRYEPYNGWSGEFTGNDDEDVDPTAGVPAVVLWPVN